MPLLKTYEEARLLWDTKGWGLGAVAKHLAEDPKLAAFKFSQPTLSRRVDDAEPIPPPVAEAIEGLETRRGCQRPTEIVEEGLRAVHGEATQQEARELALALLAHFPTNDLALKLADALLAQAQIASGNGSLLDVFALAIAGRLPHIDTAKLARTVARRIARTPLTLSLGRLAFVAVVASVAACGAWFLLGAVPGRPPPARISMAADYVVSIGADGTLRVSERRSWVDAAAQELGEKPMDQDMPVKPFPGQKVPPCDAALGEETLNQACWVYVRNVKPPCGKLFRSGNECYRPVAADPRKPVGLDPEVHGQEPR